MQLTWAEQKNQWLIPLVLGLMTLALPISSTAKSIFSVLALLLILSTPSYYQDLKNTFSKSWCLASVGLFFIALLACFWGTATLQEKMVVLEKYNKLLYLPILAVGFRDESARKVALNAFLFAMFLTFLLSVLKFFNILLLEDMNPGNVFRNYIITGYLMAFSAYLSIHLGMHQKGVSRFIYWGLWLMFSCQVIFINTGRTGLLAYALLMTLFVIQYLSTRQAIAAILIGIVFTIFIVHEDASLHKRVFQVVGEVKNYQANNKSTSLGYRIQFHQFAKTLFSRSAWIGNGTGSFTHAFAEEKPVPSWDRKLLEPHSQYWLVAAEFGLLGLTSLALFFMTLFIAAFRMKAMRPIALGLLIPFLIGNLSDSMLLISGVGFFFITFFAICLGEVVTNTHS